MVLALTCTLIGGIVFVDGCAISSHVATSISIGMTKTEVLNIAGAPHDTYDGTWLYYVWGASDPYSVDFDESGSAEWVGY
jgi:outer membrane protein assembly factor BamE (lipoprotein component of BamABCDE complex)